MLASPLVLGQQGRAREVELRACLAASATSIGDAPHARWACMAPTRNNLASERSNAPPERYPNPGAPRPINGAIIRN
eukprot:scaffold3793_cov397-Prasinococcus_capsulatus_cf.AAC.9